MRSWNGLRFWLVILLFFALASPARTVQAASVPCSASELIAAINAANASPADDVIDLQAGCTYLLAWSNNATAGGNGLPVIQAGAGSLTINGSGAVIDRAQLTWIPMIMQKGGTSQASSLASTAALQAQGITPNAEDGGSRDFRLLLVESGANLTLNDVTLQGGYLPEQNGGAILNQGTLLITSSTINGSQANIGGGIYNTGDLTVRDSTLEGNSASGSGGGIGSGDGTLTVTNTSFNSNAAPLGDGLLIGGGKGTSTGNHFTGDSEFACPTTLPYTVPDGSSADLIKALQCANSTPANDVINLATSSIYTLTAVNNDGAGSGPTGLPVLGDAAVSGSLTIIGNGATIERSSGVPDFRILRMMPGGSLTLDGVTIRNGSLPLGSVGGAMFFEGGELHLINATIANNKADYGGGIAGNDVTITVEKNSTISDNTSVHDGAGINMNGTLTIKESTFSGNHATGNQVGNGLAGGLIITGGTLTVTNSTFSGNASNAYAGGAGLMVFNLLGGVTNATISGCTFVGNHSQGGGSAIFTTVRTNTKVENSTFTANQGYGTIANNSVLTVMHSTISGNTGGGGGLASGKDATTSVGHTILVGNGQDLSGTITSLGYNLIGDATFAGSTTSDKTGVTPTQLDLGGLANNGGPTQTMALLSGSIAINTGNPDLSLTPDTDQRGMPRIVGGVIDIGAYEYP